MRKDLLKLTKTQINEIIKSLPPRFSGIVPYGVSHQNKKVKSSLPLKEDVIELFDRNTDEIRDLWGEFDIMKGHIFVMAWDSVCNWSVGVYLYENRFEIPEYKHGVWRSALDAEIPNYQKKVKQMIEYNNRMFY